MDKAFALLSLSLVILAAEANAGPSETLRCLGGLSAISDEISSSRTELSPRLARSLRGSLLMSVNERGHSVSPKDIPSGSPSDAKYCIGEDVDQASLEVLLKAYHGYLSDNPYAELGLCFAGFISVGADIEQKYGTKVGYELGLLLGKEFGARFATLKYLYSMAAPSLEAIQQMGAKRFNELSNSSGIDRARFMKEYLDICDWYGLPVRGTHTVAMMDLR